jgi:hypothetical protein
MCYTEGANTTRRAGMEKHSLCKEKDHEEYTGTTIESVCLPRKSRNRGRSSVRRKWHGERGRNVPSRCAVGEKNSPVTGVVSQSEDLFPPSPKEEGLQLPSAGGSELNAGNITIRNTFPISMK